MNDTNNILHAQIDAKSFNLIHKLVYQTIDQWAQKPEAIKHQGIISFLVYKTLQAYLQMKH